MPPWEEPRLQQWGCNQSPLGVGCRHSEESSFLICYTAEGDVADAHCCDPGCQWALTTYCWSCVVNSELNSMWSTYPYFQAAQKPAGLSPLPPSLLPLAEFSSRKRGRWEEQRTVTELSERRGWVLLNSPVPLPHAIEFGVGSRGNEGKEGEEKRAARKQPWPWPLWPVMSSKHTWSSQQDLCCNASENSLSMWGTAKAGMQPHCCTNSGSHLCRPTRHIGEWCSTPKCAH